MVRLAPRVSAVLNSVLARLGRISCETPLDHPAAAIYSLSGPLVVERGAPFTITVRITNIGSQTWSSCGRCPVIIRVYWRTSRKNATDRQERIANLPRPVHPGESLEVPITLTASDAAGQFLLEVRPEQLGGPDFAISKSAWVVVEVAAPAKEEIDYHKVYATADLDQDYWTVVGPPTEAEFHRLAQVKFGQLTEEGLLPDSHVLDVGCGTGQLAAALDGFLAEKGAYFGTDIGPEAINFCRRKYKRPNFYFAVNDFTTLPIGDRRFDMVCFFSVFTHTYPDETVLLLADAGRALKPGGKILGDIFTSPLTERCAGNRGAVELNRDHFLRLVALAGLKAELVSDWAWKSHARREVYRFTRR